MKKRVITLSKKELDRVPYLVKFEKGEMTALACAKALGISVRQFRRLVVAYRGSGYSGLAHGLRGRKSSKKICPRKEAQIVELMTTEYADFNCEHASETLEKRNNITVSAQTLRNIMDRNGVSRKKYRRKKHYPRRHRRECRGELLQFDASPHHWVGDDGPVWSLHGAIDDATSEVVGLHFEPEECTRGYLIVLRQTIAAYGRFDSAYTDQHSIFRHPDENNLGLEEQLKGKEKRETVFTAALSELGIERIAARSPQAKGRIERLWGTLQDRLISELRLHSVKGIEEANTFLQSFRLAHNQRFAVPAASDYNHFVPLTAAHNQELILAVSREQRKVSVAGTISYKTKQYRLESESGAQAPRGAIEVRVGLNGKVWALSQSHVFRCKETLADEPIVYERAPKPTLPKPSKPSPKPRRWGSVPFSKRGAEINRGWAREQKG
jgi:transposase